MILDRVFFGVLDQGAGCLLVFDEPKEDETYTASLDTIKHIGDVVDSLYEKVRWSRGLALTGPVALADCAVSLFQATKLT